MLEQTMPFIAAVSLGLLIGIERENAKSKNGNEAIIGVRTFPLLSLLGALTAYIPSHNFLYIVLSGFVALMVLFNHISIKEGENHRKIGFTTAIAAMITFILGFISYTDSQLAIILAIILFGFLSIKSRLHNFARTGITKDEMSAALTFLVSAFVILPLLPNEFIDPWNLIQPRRIWLLFVLIAGVEFSSYIALKQLGARWGVLSTGLLGGFVSATAITLNLSGRANSKSVPTVLVAAAIVLAEVSSLCVQIIILCSVAPDVSLRLIPYLALPALVGATLAFSIMMFYRKTKYVIKMEEFKNPISLKKTAGFATVISLGLISIALMSRWFGDTGVYLTSALGGAASLRVATFSVSELANSSNITIAVAAGAILLAMIVNMLVKLVLIWKVANKKLLYLSSLFFVLMFLSGILAYLQLN